MTDQISRREFDKICATVDKQGEGLTATALDIREIKTNQKNDSEKLDRIEKNMKGLSVDVTLNKTQVAKLIAWITPINAMVAYAVTRFLVK